MNVSERPPASRIPVSSVSRRRPASRDVVAIAEGDATPVVRLAVLVVSIALAGRLATTPTVWLVAALAGAATLSGTAWIVATSGSVGIRTFERRPRLVAGLVPAVAAAGATLALHAFAPRIELIVAAMAVGLIAGWSIRTERRLAVARTAPVDEDVALVVGLGLAASFVAFLGVGTVVPGGLAPAGSAPIPLPDLATVAGADALVAAAVALRLARLRAAGRRNAALAALSAAAIVAVAATALRGLAIPLVLGPALLTLVFFLWDALTGSGATGRRTVRWGLEILVLAALGAAVTLLNLRVR